MTDEPTAGAVEPVAGTAGAARRPGAAAGDGAGAGPGGAGGPGAGAGAGDPVIGWARRRREKMVAEVERNRRGGHRVPTWALALLLVAMIAAWAALVLAA